MLALLAMTCFILNAFLVSIVITCLVCIIVFTFNGVEVIMSCKVVIYLEGCFLGGSIGLVHFYLFLWFIGLVESL